MYQALVFRQAAANAPSSSWAAVRDLRCNGLSRCLELPLLNCVMSTVKPRRMNYGAKNRAAFETASVSVRLCNLCEEHGDGGSDRPTGASETKTGRGWQTFSRFRQ